ncbi:hypothetical protein [Salinispora fenicalii]|uniref:hypothetical protein n=1 Tax=Salinispora fenicalii TaxID=1137263 RepID=UPI0003699B4B|nr:hypothetical protein [Salinispora fenicalii]
MATAISMSREELLERRRRILDRVGMSYEVLRGRAASYTLQPSERRAFEALRAIDYLLGA